MVYDFVFRLCSVDYKMQFKSYEELSRRKRPFDGKTHSNLSEKFTMIANQPAITVK